MSNITDFYAKDGTDPMYEYLMHSLSLDGFESGIRIKGENRFINTRAPLIDMFIKIFTEKYSVTFGKNLLLTHFIITKDEKYWGVLISILQSKGYIKTEEKKGVDKVTKAEFSYRIATPGDKLLCALFTVKWRMKQTIR